MTQIEFDKNRILISCLPEIAKQLKIANQIALMNLKRNNMNSPVPEYNPELEPIFSEVLKELNG